MQDFEVAVRTVGGCTLVAVIGELDIATAPELTAALDEASALGSERFVVSLLRTTFIDSTGLTTLFRAHKSGSDGFSIVVAPDNLEVRRVIDLMGFNEVFTIHESLAAAGCEDGAGPGP